MNVCLLYVVCSRSTNTCLYLRSRRLLIQTGFKAKLCSKHSNPVHSRLLWYFPSWHYFRLNLSPAPQGSGFSPMWCAKRERGVWTPFSVSQSSNTCVRYGCEPGLRQRINAPAYLYLGRLFMNRGVMNSVGLPMWAHSCPC